MRKGNLRKMISAVLSFLLALSVCFTIMPGEVKAAGAQFTVTADKTELVRGDTVNVTVSLSGNTEIYGLTYEVGFDGSCLALEEIIRGDACTDLTSDSGVTSNPARIVIISSNPISDGIIMTLRFRVLDNAYGTAGITSTVQVSDEAGNKDNQIPYVNDTTPVADMAVVVPANSITLDQNVLNLKKDETAKLTATLDPPDSSNTVTWTSSNESVATVTSDGTVTAVGGGTATITASAGGKSASCTVNVNVPLNGITIAGGNSVLRGQTLELSPVFDPEDATVADKTIVWTSDNESVAKVDPATGVVTGIKSGTATITAALKASPSVLAQVAITVKEQSASDTFGAQIAFSKTKETLYKDQTENMGDLLNLKKLVEENGITDTFKITWSSSKPEIVSIDQEGKATGLKEGESKITADIVATDGSGNETGKYTVSVEVEVKEIPLKSIKFDKVITNMKVGATETLAIIFDPENTTDLKDVVWFSSDSSILAVENGVVKALKAGTAKITATSKADESISCTCEITVTAASSGTGDKPVVPGKPGNNNNSSTNGTKPGNSNTANNTVPGNNAANNTIPGNNNAANNTIPGNNNAADNTEPDNNTANNSNGSKVDDTNKNSANVSPKTGDSTDIVLFGVLVMASAAGIVVFSKRKTAKK